MAGRWRGGGAGEPLGGPVNRLAGGRTGKAFQHATAVDTGPGYRTSSVGIEAKGQKGRQREDALTLPASSCDAGQPRSPAKKGKGRPRQRRNRSWSSALSCPMAAAQSGMRFGATHTDGQGQCRARNHAHSLPPSPRHHIQPCHANSRRRAPRIGLGLCFHS